MQILRYAFPVLLVCVCLITCMAVVADASEVVTSETNVEETTETLPIPIEVSEPIPYEIVSVEVVETVRAVTPNDANGLKAVMLSLIGDYELVTKEYTYTGNNGYTSKQVTTESDYAWWFSCGVFVVVLYCVFRLLGGVLVGRK